MGANAQTTVPSFTIGQVLTADQQNQSARTGVPVFADTTARDAAFGGAGEKTLAEGQLCYLEDSNIVQYYDGAAWATVGPTTGGVVQVVSSVLDTTASTASSTYVDTGITVTITPTSASNKIAVFAMVCLGKSAGPNNSNVTLVRDSTNLIVPDTPGSRTGSVNMLTGDLGVVQNNMFNLGLSFVDSPATTSATVYKVQYFTTAGTVYINRTDTDTNSGAFARGVSTITVMEVTP